MEIDSIQKRPDHEVAREVARALLDYEVSTGPSQTYRLMAAIFTNLNINLAAACQGVGLIEGRDAVKKYVKAAGADVFWHDCPVCNDEMPMVRGRNIGRLYCLWCVIPVDVDPGKAS